ncbi:MAG: hypothetical protein ACLTDX_10840 [[Clostridium] innocuum]
MVIVKDLNAESGICKSGNFKQEGTGYDFHAKRSNMGCGEIWSLSIGSIDDMLSGENDGIGTCIR